MSPPTPGDRFAIPTIAALLRSMSSKAVQSCYCHRSSRPAHPVQKKAHPPVLQPKKYALPCIAFPSPVNVCQWKQSSYPPHLIRQHRGQHPPKTALFLHLERPSPGQSFLRLPKSSPSASHSKPHPPPPTHASIERHPPSFFIAMPLA